MEQKVYKRLKNHWGKALRNPKDHFPLFPRLVCPVKMTKMLMCSKMLTYDNTKHKEENMTIFAQKQAAKKYLWVRVTICQLIVKEAGLLLERGVPPLSLNDFYNNRFPLISLLYSARHKAECEAVLFLLWMGWEWEMSC